MDIDSFSSVVNHEYLLSPFIKRTMRSYILLHWYCLNLNDNKCNYRLCLNDNCCLLQFEFSMMTINQWGVTILKTFLGHLYVLHALPAIRIRTWWLKNVTQCRLLWMAINDGYIHSEVWWVFEIRMRINGIETVWFMAIDQFVNWRTMTFKQISLNRVVIEWVVVDIFKCGYITCLSQGDANEIKATINNLYCCRYWFRYIMDKCWYSNISNIRILKICIL